VADNSRIGLVSITKWPWEIFSYVIINLEHPYRWIIIFGVIKMHPLPETETQSSPKEAQMEGAHGATGIGASLGARI
jgi:hypothetical protein